MKNITFLSIYMQLHDLEPKKRVKKSQNLSIWRPYWIFEISKLLIFCRISIKYLVLKNICENGLKITIS